MRLFWRYERHLYQRFWKAGRTGSAMEMRWQLLPAFLPLVVMIIVSDVFSLSDRARTIGAVIGFIVMAAWAAFVFRVNWRVIWTRIKHEPVIGGDDG